LPSSCNAAFNSFSAAGKFTLLQIDTAQSADQLASRDARATALQRYSSAAHFFCRSEVGSIRSDPALVAFRRRTVELSEAASRRLDRADAGKPPRRIHCGCGPDIQIAQKKWPTLL